MKFLITGNAYCGFLDLVEELVALVVKHDEIQVIRNISFADEIEDKEGDVVTLFQPIGEITGSETLMLDLSVWGKFLEICN